MVIFINNIKTYRGTFKMDNNNKITIGLFIDTFFPMVDGVTAVVDNYAKRLVKYAYVIVFAPEYPTLEYDDDTLPYKVVRCKSVRVPFVDYMWPLPEIDSDFKKELDKYHLDIVHIHSPFGVGRAGIAYAQKHNIPAIGTMHSQYKKDFKRSLKLDVLADSFTERAMKVFNACDECWAVNKEVGRIYFEEYGYKKMPAVMNNATDMMPVDDINEAKDTINKLYNIDESDHVFLFVGRINKLKNIFFIVESLNILKKTHPDFKFKLLFVGSGQDEDELKEYIADNKLGNDIIMCGKITDKPLLAKHYARAELFLFPSLYDCSSIVQIEAASQKTPAVFLRGAATAAEITDNVNGFLCENDSAKYAEKIFNVISDTSLYNKVCENTFNDLYINWDDAILNIYNKYLEFIKNK